MGKNSARIATAVMLLMIILAPMMAVAGKKPIGPITITPDPQGFWDDSRPLPNGFLQVNQELQFGWVSSEFNGYSYQYIKGIIRTQEKGNSLVSLLGYGIFYSTDPQKPGEIYFRLRNNYYPNPDPEPGELWYERFFAERFTIQKGTGFFEGIHGYGVMDPETSMIDLYVHYEP